MDFTIPQELEDYYAELERFIDSEITPLQMEDDNNRFFDFRREDSRTDWDGGDPRSLRPARPGPPQRPAK